MASRTQGTVTLDDLLNDLWELSGSDLLLAPGAKPWVRVDGTLRQLTGRAELTPQDTERLVAERLPANLAQRLATNGTADFSFSWRQEARFRGNAYRQRGSLAMALRVIPYKIPSFDTLGIPESIRSLVDLPQGLVLMTGPTGSGKSTTLAALIDQINARRAVHVLTIEDPIEYLHRHARGAVTQREVGTDVPSFKLALRSALREDPDVLLVGEMRDLETIRTALTIAETGHLVFATLHSNDTTQAVDRIIDVFPAEQQGQVRMQLASSVQAIVHQRLLPRNGSGRVAAFEVMLATPAVQNLIREGKTQQLRNQLIAGQKLGMSTLEASLARLVAAGAVAEADAVAASLHPRELVA